MAIRFRTEIERPPRDIQPISRDSRIAMLGSCFTDNIGTRLVADGFHVTHNPMGPLYNPLSIEKAVTRAMECRPYALSEVQGTKCKVQGARCEVQDAKCEVQSTGDEEQVVWHCLDFASRYSDSDRARLLDMVNADLEGLSQSLRSADTVIITLGTAYVFFLEATGEVVGNCHKLPPQTFTRRRIGVDETEASLRRIAAALAPRRLILTVSPVRHTADTLHGNQLSKATLLLGADTVCAEGTCEYFPAYEILNDDLRDYRFYAADLKHPSETAAHYVYSHFCDTYFTPATMQAAEASRRETLRSAHRPILKQ